MPRSLYFLLLLLFGATQLPACAQSATDQPAAGVPTVAMPGRPLPWLDSLLAASPVLARHQVGISLAVCRQRPAVLRLPGNKILHPGQHHEAV